MATRQSGRMLARKGSQWHKKGGRKQSILPEEKRIQTWNIIRGDKVTICLI
jgi:hypothetical protein